MFSGIRLKAFQEVLMNMEHVFENDSFKVTSTSPRGKWVKGDGMVIIDQSKYKKKCHCR